MLHFQDNSKDQKQSQIFRVFFEDETITTNRQYRSSSSQDLLARAGFIKESRRNIIKLNILTAFLVIVGNILDLIFFYHLDRRRGLLWSVMVGFKVSYFLSNPSTNIFVSWRLVDLLDKCGAPEPYVCFPSKPPPPLFPHPAASCTAGRSLSPNQRRRTSYTESWDRVQEKRALQNRVWCFLK